MRSFSRSFLVVAPVFAYCAAALSGCQSGSAWSTKPASVSVTAVQNHDAGAEFTQRHQFYYYPAAGVYRDCDEDRWLWSENGGVTWTTARCLPAEYDVGDEVPFVVFLTLNSPMIEHHMIVAAYPPEAAFGPSTATAQGAYADIQH